MTTSAVVDIDLFISHAWEDKESLVRPLARYLRNLGARVWYDEFSLAIGDSLSRSIDRGLAVAQYGLVIVSSDFIQKRWTEYELRGLTAREVHMGGKVILPIWHGVSKQDVMDFSPSLADKVAIDTRDKSIEEIAEAIVKVIRPDLAKRAGLLRYLVRDRREDSEDEVSYVKPGDIKGAPIPAEFVMEGHVVVRALNVVNVLHPVAPKIVGEFSKFLTDLARDHDPEPELRIWEAIAAVFLQTDSLVTLSPAERHSVIALALFCSLDGRREVRQAIGKDLDSSVVQAVIERWDYLGALSHAGHVRFVTRSISEDASSGEIVDE